MGKLPMFMNHIPSGMHIQEMRIPNSNRHVLQDTRPLRSKFNVYLSDKTNHCQLLGPPNLIPGLVDRSNSGNHIY